MFSISYFFFIYKTESQVWRSINVIVYNLILLAFIIAGLAAFGGQSNSKCASTAYGKMVMVFALAEVLSGALIIILSAILANHYRNNKKLPEWITGPEEHED